MRIFIPGNVPALKNSKQIIQIPIKGARACPLCKHKKGRPMLTSGKRHKEYVKATMGHWIQGAYIFKTAAKDMPRPLHITFFFHRKSRHQFDYTNALDTLQDLMVEHGWIPDDNAYEMIPVISGYEYDKDKPGVTIML